MTRIEFLWPLLCAWAVTSSLLAANGAGRCDGLIVCIGEKALERTSGEWDQSGRIFHCLETSDAQVDALRRKLAAARQFLTAPTFRIDIGWTLRSN